MGNCFNIYRMIYLNDGIRLQLLWNLIYLSDKDEELVKSIAKDKWSVVHVQELREIVSKLENINAGTINRLLKEINDEMFNRYIMINTY